MQLKSERVYINLNKPNSSINMDFVSSTSTAKLFYTGIREIDLINEHRFIRPVKSTVLKKHFLAE